MLRPKSIICVLLKNSKWMKLYVWILLIYVFQFWHKLYIIPTLILFPMKALRSTTPILSPLLSKMWCGTTLFQLGPFGLLWCNFIGLAMRLLNRWYWVLVKPKCDHPFFHHVHFDSFDNWNKLAKISCASWNNMAFYTQCLSFLLKIPYQN